MHFQTLHLLAYQLMFGDLGTTLSKMKQDYSDTDRSAPVFEQWVQYGLQHIKSLHQQQSPQLYNNIFDFLQMSSDVKHRINGHRDPQEFEAHRYDAFKHLLPMLAAAIPLDASKMYFYFTEADAHHSQSKTLYWTTLKQNNLLPNPKHDDIQRTWQYVISNCCIEAAQFLLDHGCSPSWNATHNISVSETYDPKDNFLALISNSQRFKLLQTLPDKIVKPLIHRPNSKGEYPIHLAARHLLPDYIQYLIQRGAKVDVTTKKGLYPFDMIKRTKTRSTHLDEVIDLVGQHSSKSANALLVQACCSMNVKMMRKAKDQGADVHNTINNMNVLEMVFSEPAQSRWNHIRQQQPQITQWLLEQNCTHDADQRSILEYAIKNGAVDSVGVILENQPLLATSTNNEGLRPAEYVTETPHGSSERWMSSSIQSKLRAQTQVQIFEHYRAHNIPVSDSDFPLINADPTLKADKDKHILQTSLTQTNNPNAKQRKM